MGWQMIGTIVINCVINVTLIVSIGGKGLYLIALKYYRLAKVKICGYENKDHWDTLAIKKLNEEEFVDLQLRRIINMQKMKRQIAVETRTKPLESFGSNSGAKTPPRKPQNMPPPADLNFSFGAPDMNFLRSQHEESNRKTGANN